ncbi:MAG: hypothetical protein OIF35_12510, partial [Cellvibrionaceae bacterium]|nr:hypothetical protein [Cellvibrionaceae bacterium]
VRANVACPILPNYCKSRIYPAALRAPSLSRSGDFVGTPPRVQAIRGGGARNRQCIRFKTYSHPDFKFYDDAFYLDYKYRGRSRKKRVPENINELLNARSLAYWFMDDGNALSINQKWYYLFSTQSFPKGARRAIQALSHNFGVVGLRP